MSDGEVSPGDPGTTGAGGGPGPRQGPLGPRPNLASPAAVAPMLDTQYVLGATTASSPEDLLHVRYARHGVTPIPWMVASAVMIAASVWAVRWSEFERGAPDPVTSSEWWVSTYSVLLPAHDLRLGSYSQFRMWVTLAVLVGTAAVLAAWIGRIGRNLRSNAAPFGSVLAIIAFPAWWVLPLTIGSTDVGVRSRGDLLVRALIAFGLLFAQFLLMRWPLVNRIWRAGHLPYDLASIVLWLPMLIPWSLYLLSTSYTLMVTGKGDDPRDSAWQPTSTMIDWARNLTHATEVGMLLLLVVVTAAQHIGLRKDRAEEQARRDASAATAPLAF